MSTKIAIAFSLLGLLLLGSVLAQTKTNQQTNSNISTDTNRLSNVAKKIAKNFESKKY